MTGGEIPPPALFKGKRRIIYACCSSLRHRYFEADLEKSGSVREERSNLRPSETFAALRHYNYRLWFIGQMVSLMGTWMQSTAQGYLIYQLTSSPTYLGLVGFMGGLPTWLFTLFGGVIADRISRRTLMVITQTSMMILAFILGALAFVNAVRPWHILVLAFLLGVANAFDAPARVSFVIELVPREDMTNAIALNSTMFNIATVVGPSVAGLTYAAFGPAWCFTLNGISFIAVIVALILMRIKRETMAVRRSTAYADIAEGLRYVFASRLVRSLTGAVGLVSVFGFGLMNLIPAWATDVLHGNEVTNGLLVSARGFGALVSALMLASMVKLKISRKNVDGRRAGHAGRAFHLCLGSLGSTVAGSDGRPGLEPDDDHQQQQCTDPIRGPGRPARTGHGRLCVDLQRLDPDRGFISGHRRPAHRRAAHRGAQRGRLVRLRPGRLDFFPGHPPAVLRFTGNDIKIGSGSQAAPCWIL